MSSKGTSKAQNELLWQRYEMALEGHKEMATNRGFRMHQGAMYTYEQRSWALALTMTSAGCCQMESTQSLWSSTSTKSLNWRQNHQCLTNGAYGQLNKRARMLYPTMGRGRSGFLVSSKRQMRSTTKGHWGCGPEVSPPERKIMLTPQDMEVAKRLTKEQLAYILFKENESKGAVTKISEATECLATQPATPHERSPAWVRHTNNTQAAHLVW